MLLPKAATCVFPGNFLALLHISLMLLWHALGLTLGKPERSRTVSFSSRLIQAAGTAGVSTLPTDIRVDCSGSSCTTPKMLCMIPSAEPPCWQDKPQWAVSQS